MSHVTATELALWQRAGFEFELIDVRRAAARSADGTHIAGDAWLDPALWLDWKNGVRRDRPVVLYCAHGREISQGLCAALRVMGADARHLAGGIAGWQSATLPVQPIDLRE
jgi:rhodanese-related sulfurtransferase